MGADLIYFFLLNLTILEILEYSSILSGASQKNKQGIYFYVV